MEAEMAVEVMAEAMAAVTEAEMVEAARAVEVTAEAPAE